MCQWQCPQTQVRSCVGDWTQDELNCFDNLMNCYLTDVLMMITGRLYRFACFFKALFVKNISWLFLHLLTVLGGFVWISQWDDKILVLDFFVNMMGFVCGLLSLEPDNKRFREEHPWNTDQWDYQQVVLKSLLICLIPQWLSLSWSHCKGKSNHLPNDRGCNRSISLETPCNSPLINNQDTHVSKCWKEEDLLW